MTIRPGAPPHRRGPLFCDVALAARVEANEAGSVIAAGSAARARRGEATGFAMSLAGGVANYSGPHSPFNKLAGLGFSELPTTAELEAIEAAYAAQGAPVQVELAQLGDPALARVLCARGYRVEAFENVLGARLGREPVQPVAPAGIEIRRSDWGGLDAWLDMMADAAAVEDEQGLAWHEEFPRQTYIDTVRDMVAAGARPYAAMLDGHLAGGALVREAGGVALMPGAATAVAHRRQGIHSALLAARLADAEVSGCDLAVVTTQPGSKSQQNVQRLGLDLLYTRTVLVKRP